MEELIPFFIFLLIWILALFRKLVPKNRPTSAASPVKPHGIIASLNEFFTKIQQQVEAQKKAEQGTAAASPWRRLMEESQALKKEPAPLPDLVFDPDDSDIPTQSEPTELPRRERSDRLKETASPPDIKLQSKPAFKAPRRHRVGFRMGRRKLRRAVIWAEILGPPAALKDRRENRW